MFNSYTDQIQYGMTFPDFVMRCATASKVLSCMFDTPLDAPIPSFFKESTYYSEKIQELAAQINYLNSLTLEEAQLESNKEHEKEVSLYAKYKREDEVVRSKYIDMLKKVKNWVPPTEDHDLLKELMLEQIHKAIERECDLNVIMSPLEKPLPAEDWLRSKTKETSEKMKSVMEGFKRENKEVEYRNLWLAQLRESLDLQGSVHALQPYQYAVYSERAELNSKIEKLSNFMKSHAFKKCSNQEKELVALQHSQMLAYNSTLNTRILNFSKFESA